MAISLASLRQTTTLTPPRILIHGVAGVGKTTFAAKSDRPVIVATEEGLGTLDVPHFPLATTFDDVLSAKGGTSVAMLTQFMTDWFAETKKWADATVKTAAAESDENKAILTKWITEWRDRAAAALVPVARIALGDRTDELVGEVVQQFNARMAKAGVAL